jgi:hypothetical protein
MQAAGRQDNLLASTACPFGVPAEMPMEYMNLSSALHVDSGTALLG